MRRYLRLLLLTCISNFVLLALFAAMAPAAHAEKRLTTPTVANCNVIGQSIFNDEVKADRLAKVREGICRYARQDANGPNGEGATEYASCMKGVRDGASDYWIDRPSPWNGQEPSGRMLLRHYESCVESRQKADNTHQGFVDRKVSEAATGALATTAGGFADAAAELTDTIASELSTKADPVFAGAEGAWFRKQYRVMFTLALTLMFLFAIISFGGAAMKGDQAAIARTLGTMIAAVVLTGSALAFVTLGLQFTDAFTDEIMKPFKENIEAFLTNLSVMFSDTATQSSNGGLALALIMSIFLIIGCLALLVVLVLRGALIYGVVLFMPFLFAAWIWPATRPIFQRGMRWIVMLILVKFVMFALLATSSSLLATIGAVSAGGEDVDSSAAAMVFGIGGMFLAAASPVLILALLPHSFAGAASAAGSAARGGGRVAGGAVGGATATLMTIAGRGRPTGAATGGSRGSAAGAVGSLAASSSRTAGTAAGAPAPSSGAAGATAATSRASTSSSAPSASGGSPDAPRSSTPSYDPSTTASRAAASSVAPQSSPAATSLTPAVGAASTPPAAGPGASASRLAPHEVAPADARARTTAMPTTVPEPHIVPRRGVQAQPNLIVNPSMSSNSSVQGV